jgi:hypothetical protein
VILRWKHFISVGIRWEGGGEGTELFVQYFLFNPFKFIRNKHRVSVHRGFICPLIKCRDVFSEGSAAHPVGNNRPLQMKMAIRRTFFEFELNGSGSQLKTIVLSGALQILKKLAKPPIVGSHTRPDHTAKYFAEGRRALRAVKAP